MMYKHHLINKMFTQEKVKLFLLCVKAAKMKSVNNHLSILD